MAEHSDVVDRADALMRRRNSFVAAQAKRAGSPANEDDDLPVLTEIIPAEPAEPAEPTEMAEAAEAVTTLAAFDAPAAVELLPAFEAPAAVETPAADETVDKADGFESIESFELPELFADTVMPPLDAVAKTIAEGSGQLDEKQVAQLAAEIGEAIAQRMHFELPTLVEAALVKTGEELRAGIASTISDAVREVVAQRKRVPPPDAKK
jgi:hypothetical protein